MGSEIKCYCEVDFLKDFFLTLETLNPFDDEVVTFRQYFDLFLKEITVDSREKFITLIKENPNNKYLISRWKKITDAVSTIEEILLKSIDFLNVNPHAVFFLSKTEKCSEMEDDFGLLFISNETKKEKAKLLFNREEISFTKGSNYKNYDFITSKKFRHPCNCLIINDRYLLREKMEDVRENLSSMLKNILPDNLNKQIFQILIISECNTIKDRYPQIIDILEGLNKKYKIELKIIAKNADHNRHLITNYLTINTGHKFTLFNHSKVKTEDQMKFSSIVGNADVKEVVNDLMKKYRKIEYETINIGSEIVVLPQNKCGIVTNRLLNH